VVRIYTRTGDDGQTSLFGGTRVGKSDARLDAYGSLDELNAYLGWFRSRTQEADLADLVHSIQPVLFDLGAHLATPPEAEKTRRVLPPVRGSSVKDLEDAIDRLESELDPLTSFVLPGGTEDSALLQVARAVSRRAERAVVRAMQEHRVSLPPAGLPYLNRLSDLLFVMARVANRRGGGRETLWTPERPGD
jgi:cob(I)alamin adenosyltransferase